ncbi:MAG: GDP-mannose 4,6-dehydratase [Candidatus Omnitrophica bacterium]|nr:GDP-mannose 4,6-dehydratase [Candidatus Omnitrophota bacterium]
MKKALITGITGQDGSYMAEFLLSKGYQVHGLIRRVSTPNLGRIEHISDGSKSRLKLHYGDLSDLEQVSNIIYNIKPDEIYNLGAQSHVRLSFDMPEYTGDVTGLGTTRILEVIRRSGRKIKFYQASSSEMFGTSPAPQNENTPFRARSPYSCAKVYAHEMTKNYRDGYGIFAVNGIAFNHESPRRGEAFVTRKITRAVASIVAKKQNVLYLGYLDVERDWGYAPEYVEAMWKMLQMDKPDDLVLGTGKLGSVKNFVKEAFSYVGLDWRKYVKIDGRFFRPTEVCKLVADSSKARKSIGWKPKVRFGELMKIMIDADMRAIGIKPVGEGDALLREKFPKRWWRID